MNVRPVRLVLCCSLLLGACTEPRPPVLGGSSGAIEPEDYPAVLEAWTRSDKIYQGLDTKLFITATYHAPEFRRAFAVAFPDIYGHGGQVTRRELVDLMGDVEQYNTFFVAMYTPEREWNDLEQPDSIWRLNLIGKDGASVTPAKIEAVTVDANLMAVYPYIGKFDECYLVRFPLTDPMNRLLIQPETEGFRLRVASALGIADLRWELETSTAE